MAVEGVKGHHWEMASDRPLDSEPAQWSTADGVAADLAEAKARLREIERIGQLGSFDWDIATDTNRWSDELYRVYGTEPGSFNPSYDRFLAFVHPEDRESVQAVHRAALEARGPFAMEERIVRSDGQVRVLRTAGEVVCDSEGNPARMVGVCMDVTEQRRAEADALAAAHRFESLVESSPDAVLVIDSDGRIIQVNGRAEDVFGHPPDSLVGRSVTDLLPEASEIATGARATGATLTLSACRADGTTVPVDVSLSTPHAGPSATVTAFVRDVSERVQAETNALRLHDAEVRRRHALEINDTVVQGLSTAYYALDTGHTPVAQDAIASTMEAARMMMDDLLDASDTAPLLAGDLVRGSAAGLLGASSLPGPSAPVADQDGVRVLLVDDADDLRLIMRLGLVSHAGIDVAGEARDGREAIAMAATLQPDVVLLDLAMPVMDGLEALPGILAAAPASKVVVLSGFDDLRMRNTAMELGAAAYVEKGTSTSDIVEAIASLNPEWVASLTEATASAEPADPFAAPPADGAGLDLDQLVHELRTPLTVIQGLASTLVNRGDQLASATASELMQALFRNSRQMANLLDSVASARDLNAGLVLYPEPTPITHCVSEVLKDLAPVLEGRTVSLDLTGVDEEAVAEIDPLRMRQVLTNLITNAVRFSPAGTPIEVTVTQTEGGFAVTCRDHGPGIPAEKAAELFRAHSRLGAEGPGMGLGLYISHGIARAHGGDLRYSPAPGGGSRFELTFPARVPAPAE